MKRSELKKILKPLIQECIKESLLEDGLISGIIAEVMRGINSPQPIVETEADIKITIIIMRVCILFLNNLAICIIIIF